LFGGLQVRCGRKTLTRFRTQKTAALLAYLAYHHDRLHAREVLIDLFWPDAPSPENGRVSLSVALSSLRNQLEPPGVPAHSVVIADRHQVGLNAGMVTTDVHRFETLLDQAERADSDSTAAPLLREAIGLYRGALLPGFYEPWIVPQQVRLADRFAAAARRLAQVHEAEGDLESATLWTRHAVQSDPTSSEAVVALVRLLVATGQAAAAATALREIEGRLAREYRDTPPAEAYEILGPLFERGDAGEGGTSTPPRRSGVRTPRRETQANSPAASAVPGHADFAFTPGNTAPSPATAALATATPPRAAAATAAPKAEMAPTAPVVARQAPLPQPLTRLFGREEEMLRLGWLLRDPSARLITLTGPGGSGKTRLALAVAGEQRRQSGGGAGSLPPYGRPPFESLDDRLSASMDDRSDERDVFFVSLSDVTEAHLLPAALADAMSLNLFVDTATDILEMLVDVLSARPALLILDNFDQLVHTDAPRFLEALLSRVPTLTCLVTSRKRLPVPGEREFFVTPLPTPDLMTMEGDLGHEEPETIVREWPCVALFVDRAQQAAPGFRITRKNAAAIAQLVTRLEGIPLAIELAAARSQVLTPSQMLGKIPEGRFDLLVHRRWGNADHRNSLWESVALSYRMLTPDLRRCFTRLSVFRGGFTAVDAAAVTDDDLIFDHLAELCDASLLQSQPDDEAETIRFHMLETLREFAAEQMSTEERTEAQRSHALRFTNVAEEAKAQLQGPEQMEAMARLSAEKNNLRAALSWSLSSGNVEASFIGMRLGHAMHLFWRLRGLHNEGCVWLRSLLAAPFTNVPAGEARYRTLRADVVNGLGILEMTCGEFDAARARYQESLALRRQIDDARGIAGVLNNLAIVERECENLEAARDHYEESLAIWRALGERCNVGIVLSNLAMVLTANKEFTRARGLFEESLEIARETGNTASLAIRLHNLAEVMYEESDYAEAERLFRESLRFALTLSNLSICAYGLLSLGFLAIRAGKERTGEAWVRTALHYCDAAPLPLPAFARRQMDLLGLMRQPHPSLLMGSVTPPQDTLDSAEEALRSTLRDVLAETTDGTIETAPADVHLPSARLL
jgi:predicted ATPase/DNA-binding SARP family transcriptional activator